MIIRKSKPPHSESSGLNPLLQRWSGDEISAGGCGGGPFYTAHSQDWLCYVGGRRVSGGRSECGGGTRRRSK